MRLFHCHQILLAHAFARSAGLAVCVLDINEPRAKVFDADYDRLMATVSGIASPKALVPQSTGDLQFVELTGGPCSHIIQLAYAAETKPERDAAKAARQRERYQKWETAQGLAMRGAT